MDDEFAKTNWQITTKENWNAAYTEIVSIKEWSTL